MLMLSARNNLRAMKKGDLSFFYHSSCKVPAIVGIMEIVQEHTPDRTNPLYQLCQKTPADLASSLSTRPFGSVPRPLLVSSGPQVVPGARVLPAKARDACHVERPPGLSGGEGQSLGEHADAEAYASECEPSYSRGMGVSYFGHEEERG
jgi:EVE domain